MNASITLAELGHAECLRLLGTAMVGRVVFTEGALPAVRPVNFVLDGADIVFRTAANSTLAQATRRRAVVAFEVDEIDLATHTGWSVVVIGRAYEIVDIDRLVRLSDPHHAPWPDHRSAHTIAIPVEQISGRRLVLHQSS